MSGICSIMAGRFLIIGTSVFVMGSTGMEMYNKYDLSLRSINITLLSIMHGVNLLLYSPTEAGPEASLKPGFSGALCRRPG